MGTHDDIKIVSELTFVGFGLSYYSHLSFTKDIDFKFVDAIMK